MKLPWSRNSDNDIRDDDERDERGEFENGEIENERKVASVNKGLRPQARLLNLAVGFLVVAFAGWALFTYYKGLLEERAARQDRNVDTTQTAQTRLPPINMPALQPAPQSASAPEAPPAPNVAAAGRQGKREKTPQEIELEERLLSPVKFKLDTQAASGRATAGTATGSSQRGSASGLPGQDRLSQSLQSAQLAPVEAYHMGDASFMLYQGAAIPCTVREAINSTLAGQVTCVQSEDVYSETGVLLAERGTIYTGQQIMGMQRGQRRVAVVWTRGRTPLPNNVAFDLNSAATDELGRTGLSGEIDTHWMERFGPIIALSLVDDIGSYLVATGQQGSGNTTIGFGNTANGTQELFSEVFKEAANIPPTLTRNQGADIFIYVARDIDFSGVYSLEYQ